MEYHVMRQDEHGNVAIVGGDTKPACYHSREGADAVRSRLEASGHKQTYWVQPVLKCEHEQAPA